MFQTEMVFEDFRIYIGNHFDLDGMQIASMVIEEGAMKNLFSRASTRQSRRNGERLWNEKVGRFGNLRK